MIRNALLLSMLTISSITAHAYNLNRIEFDISKKDLPETFEAVVAFIYETSDGHTPGVVRIKESPGSYSQWPFSIKTESQFISVTHAEVMFLGQMHEKYQVNPNCTNMKVLYDNGQGMPQMVFLEINPRDKVLSCSPRSW